MNQPDYKTIFVPDCGMLLDIKIFDVNAQDWQKLLDLLLMKYAATYSEDAVVTRQPAFVTIWQRRLEKTVQVNITLAGLLVVVHFFGIEEIEMDLRPEDVDSEDKAQAIYHLMSDIARELGKEAFLVQEHGSASTEELKQMMICSADPKSGEIKYNPKTIRTL